MTLNAHAEEPRRLVPLRPVAQQLWLSSGNRCAFKDCREVIMDPDGTLLGEIAHLRSPMPDGPRYDRSYSSEQCRGFDNLGLLCQKHHTIVDDQVEKWPVERLAAMKAQHEQIYTGAVDQLRKLVGDITSSDSPRPALNGKRVLGDLDDVELRESLPLVNCLCEGLQQVPLDARSALALLVEVSSSGTDLPLQVLLARADTPEAVLSHLQVLEHFGLVDIDVPDADSDYKPHCNISRRYAESASLLKDLSVLDGIEVVRRAVVDLDFTVFDEI